MSVDVGKNYRIHISQKMQKRKVLKEPVSLQNIEQEVFQLKLPN